MKIYQKVGLITISLLSFKFSVASTSSNSFAHPLDSIGVEIINGEEYVLFKIEKGDNYYQLSKKYKTTVEKLTSINGNNTLALGQIVKVPTGRKPAPTSSTARNAKNATNDGNQGDYTEYIVGETETLYAISRRFSVTVEQIKKANNLKNNTIKGGMRLRIPTSPANTVTKPELPVPIKPDTIVQVPAIPDSTDNNTDVKANRYGIREKSEHGIGVWIKDLSSQGSNNLALHKTAPIGTILKITNPMNQRVTYAKVVGKFTDNAENQNAIVVISKSAAESIGALDKRFQIQIAYGIPLEN